MPTRRGFLLVGGALLAVVAVAVGARHWLWSRWHVSTDDAYVEGHVASVTPRVAGAVSAVLVNDNFVVQAGDTLVQLDQSEFIVRLQQATATLNQARQTVEQQLAALEAARAEEALAVAQLEEARVEFARVARLRERHVVSADEYDHARTALAVAQARRDAAARAVEQAEAALGPAGTDPYDRAIVRQAASARAQAELALEWTTITAAVGGVVTRRAVEAGQHVQPGQPLMALVPFDLYVVANFKETELTPVRVGQPVDLRVDLYPHADFRGHVDSIASGTGAVFSLLPPENASGNWVKVVQRVPVKVVVDRVPEDYPLRVGLSVRATVDVSDRSGALLGAAGQAATAATR